jgi:hypothetical protein
MEQATHAGVLSAAQDDEVRICRDVEEDVEGRAVDREQLDWSSSERTFDPALQTAHLLGLVRAKGPRRVHDVSP